MRKDKKNKIQPSIIRIYGGTPGLLSYTSVQFFLFAQCDSGCWLTQWLCLVFPCFCSSQSINCATQSCIAAVLLSHSTHFNSHNFFFQDLDCDKLNYKGGPAERRKSCCTGPPALFSWEKHKTWGACPKHTLELQKWGSCQAKLFQMTTELSLV